ncbi:MAG: SusC/RagA family TonB-linked outer membrane protein [Chitinophagaceae bacterium]|nr:SusC/RagA family TonB-linked outer membrane protein [Chitinophagaceae bacterium]
MRKKTFAHALTGFFLLLSLSIFAQNKTVSGTVKDQDGAGVSGASVVVKGSNLGTNTDASGAFTLSVPSNARTLVISFVGLATQEVAIGDAPINVSLKPATSNDLNEVVVVGYGSARKKDLTGSVASVTAKEFNTGQINSPEQLLQGKVAGVQITNSSGQPGGLTIVRIRGNNSIRSGNNPLYVVDGMALDGRTARPNFSATVGTSPPADPLTFINPNEIAQVDILKDASASAIYGSRGANGVVLITTKKGQTGPTRIDANASVGIASVMRKVDVLDAAGYRNAISKFGAANSDSGLNIDPFDEILDKGALTQNYSVALGGGGENGKYRASFFIGDQDGVIRKTNLRKYVGNLNGQFKFMDKKLSLDFNAAVADVTENVAPISQDAGSGGNLISAALIWNPTLTLKRANGIYNQENPSGLVNPLALSDAYNDIADVVSLLGNISAGYKFTDWLEYKMLYGINYSTGNRRAEIQGWIRSIGGNAQNKGEAGVFQNTLQTSTLTHTLNFTKDLSEDINLTALAGYEFWRTNFRGFGNYVYDFNYNLEQSAQTNVHYYDNMNAGRQGNMQQNSFRDPTVDIQSYFARATVNYQDKYLLTATIRADGSSKFGKDNKYAYFPSFSAAWNIDREEFMKDNNVVQNLKLRAGYGETGNQEFVADAALDVFRWTSFGNYTQIHSGNPALIWESVRSYNIGLDFTTLQGRVYGSIDYFHKTTEDPVILQVASQPQPPGSGGAAYKNIEGAKVLNYGVEVNLGIDAVKSTDLLWQLNLNGTFLKNRFDYPQAGEFPLILTGGLHGQGTTNAFAQAIAHDQPINVYYLNEFQGFDKDGIAQYSRTPGYRGDPNPKAFLGFTSDLTYKKWFLSIGAHGSFGNYLFNNTLMSVLNISNIVGGRNIASQLVNSGESVANPISTSDRFMEKGDYLKVHNITLKYTFGDIGKYMKGFNVYIAANNLFVLTDYSGFDPEVNVDKALNGVPSLGIDYIGFPTQRTILLGLNFSL